MECPKCGKQLLAGEICSCDGISVYQRELELRKERELEEELQQEEQVKKTEKKARIAGKAADVADDALKNATSFLTRTIHAILKKEDAKDYSNELSITEVAVVCGINILTTIMMIYVVFTQSVFAAVLIPFTILTGKGGMSIFMIAALVVLFAEISIILIRVITQKKSVSDIIRKSCNFYIYAIPCAFLVILFSWINIFCMVFLFFLFSIWIIYIQEELTEATKDKPVMFPVCLLIHFTVVSIIAQVLMSALI